MGDGNTRAYRAVVPGGVAPAAIKPPVWNTHLMASLLILGAGATEYSETKDLCYDASRGILLLAARRNSDGLWVTLQIDLQKKTLLRGKPRGQILGLQWASGQPLYVGMLPDMKDNRPRVYLGEGEGKPYDAINHEELQWHDGEPLYPASLDGKEFVVQGTREGKPGDEVIPPLLFVGRRPLYRKRLNRKILLVWGEEESAAASDISLPCFDGREITAFAADGSLLRRLSIKTM